MHRLAWQHIQNSNYTPVFSSLKFFVAISLGGGTYIGKWYVDVAQSRPLFFMPKSAPWPTNLLPSLLFLLGRSIAVSKPYVMLFFFFFFFEVKDL